MFRTVLADEACQRVDHGEPLIARRYATPTRPLQVLEEKLYALWSDPLNRKLIDLFAHGTGDEWDEQGERIAVTALSVER
jgi:hypothetical protein